MLGCRALGTLPETVKSLLHADFFTQESQNLDLRWTLGFLNLNKRKLGKEDIKWFFLDLYLVAQRVKKKPKYPQHPKIPEPKWS